MNQNRQTKMTRLFNRLKHVIHPDAELTVRRRDLHTRRHGDVQLELDFGDSKPVLQRQNWLDISAIEPEALH